MSDKSLSQEKINNLILLYKKGLIKEALVEAEQLIENNPNSFFLHNIYGMINMNLKKWNKSIESFSKAIKIKQDYAEAHNNLGVALNNLAHLEKAIESYSNAIKFKPDYANAHNNLGSVFNDLGRWEEALESYSKALEYNPENNEAHENLIKLLTFYKPKKANSNSIVIANQELQNIKYNYNSNKKITDNEISNFFKKCNKIILKNKNKINFNRSQIYRRNTIDLNCNRHLEVFNNFNAIPEYCFGCYKVQVEPKTIIELFKLYFVFDQLQLPQNNSRKCLVELRPEISGTYKGLIYCFNLNEANEIFKILKNILKNTINDEIQIKIRRGCSEFAISYPDYKEINQNGDQLMKYKDKWREKEKIVDEKLLNETQRKNKKVVKDSLTGVTLNDVLIMYNWLNYAKAVGDNNYQTISKDILKSTYIENELSQQLDIRNKEFSSIH